MQSNASVRHFSEANIASSWHLESVGSQASTCVCVASMQVFAVELQVCMHSDRFNLFTAGMFIVHVVSENIDTNANNKIERELMIDN